MYGNLIKSPVSPQTSLDWEELAVNRARRKALCHGGDADPPLTVGKQTLWHTYARKAEGWPHVFTLPDVFVKALQVLTWAQDR